MTVDKRDSGTPVVLTGRIEAENEAALAFRTSGRVIENNTKLGDRVQPGQILARLEPHNELNALRAAQASLAAANALLVRARNQFARQETLVRAGLDLEEGIRRCKAGDAGRPVPGRDRWGTS